MQLLKTVLKFSEENMFMCKDSIIGYKSVYIKRVCISIETCTK